MTKAKIIYEEREILIAKYCHPKSDDHLEYNAHIKIKDSGKNPTLSGTTGLISEQGIVRMGRVPEKDRILVDVAHGAGLRKTHKILQLISAKV